MGINIASRSFSILVVLTLDLLFLFVALGVSAHPNTFSSSIIADMWRLFYSTNGGVFLALSLSPPDPPNPPAVPVAPLPVLSEAPAIPAVV